MKFRIEQEEESDYPCSENKGADHDQLCSYCTADLRLCFAYAKIRFSHEVAHLTLCKIAESVVNIKS